MVRKKVALAITIIILFSVPIFSLKEASGLDDTTPPLITNVNWIPRHPSSDDAISISARITDDSGVAWAKVTYCIGTSCYFADMSGSGGSYYSSIGPFSEGLITFNIIARDNAGNTGQSPEYSFTVDGTNPTVQVLYPNGGELVAGTITITWAAHDNIDTSLSITIEYSDDTGTTWQHVAQLSGVDKYDWNTVSIGEGNQYLLRVSALDDAGNKGTDRSDSYFTIDNTPPKTSHSFDGVLGENNWYTSPVEITLSPIDTLSGINSTHYRINTGSWLQYTSPFTVSNSGEYYLEYYSIDNAGNEETNNNITFKINKEKPIVTIDTPKRGYLYIGGREITSTFLGMTIIIGNISVEVTATDETSFVTKVEFYVDDILKSTDTEHPYTWHWDDSSYFFHVLRVTAYNGSGNNETNELRVFTLLP